MRPTRRSPKTADAGASRLIGRDRELRVLFERIDGAIEQGGSALLIRGQAGIGKSTLLEAARAYASSRRFQILATTGVQSESHLPFSGLHQLLRPILEAVDRLPDAYGLALRGAFGLSQETNQNPFQIALSVLHLLGDCSESAPILLLVDDLQWLDRPTTDALAFVARRLESDPIALLAVLRDGFENPIQGVRPSELNVEALSDADAASLLDAHAPNLNAGLRDRVIEVAAGNPLALIELPLAATQGVERARPLERLPLTERLERAFADRLSGLASETRSLLRVAATDENSLLAELLRVASKLEGHEITLEAVTEARNAGLVEIDGNQLRFRHPLMRSAIHQAMSLRERQAAHAALAATLDDDPDRRVWHRAAATLGSNEQIAVDLEAAALHAEKRGALGVALEATERAAQLADDPARRGTRLMHAAYLAVVLGRHRDIVRLLGEINDQELKPMDRPHVAWLREVYAQGTWSGPSMIASFVAIAEQKRERGEFKLGLSTLYDIAVRCWWSNPDEETRSALISVAERFPVPEDDARLLAVLALGGPVERGAIVLDRLSRLPTELHTDLGWQGNMLGLAAMAVGDFLRAERFLESGIRFGRSHGLLGMLTTTLVSQAWTKIARGDWKSAVSIASEATRLAEETAIGPYWVAAANLSAATVAAYRGQVDVAEDLVAPAEQTFLPKGAITMLALVQYPRGAAALAAGRYDEAYHHLRRVFDSSDSASHPHVRSWTLVDLVEAAVLSGHEDEAAGFVKELESIAARTRSPILEGALQFARPVLSSGGNDSAFHAGAELAIWPFTRARLQLAHGIWLRRQRRPADARTPLRAARDAFDALGAAPWGERARQELRASGETSRQRSYELADALSPQELQIAQLAAAGMTNKEIGRQLFLSHRTISSHLYKVFPKLGITARSHLRAALQDQFSE